MRRLAYMLALGIGLAGMCTTTVRAAEVAIEDVSNEYSNVLDEMTDEELSEMCRVLFLECRGEPFEGKVACVEVIFNRVLSDAWPDTVHEVLSQKGQFATYKHIETAYDVDEDDIEIAQGEICRAIMHVHDNGLTVLPNERYVYFDTHGVNGRNHIKVGRQYFGEGH